MARPRRTASRLTSYTEEMARRGLLAESQTLLARREQAGPGVARALNVTEGDAVIHWRRLRRADGSPMCIEDAYLNEVLIPGFLQSGMPTSLYDALESARPAPDLGRGLDQRRRRQRRGGRAASRSTAGAPVLRHSRRGARRREGRRGVAHGLPRRPLHPVAAGRRRGLRLSVRGCSARQSRPAARRRRRSPRRPTPGPGRRGRAGCRARAAGASSPQSRQTGQRPTVSKSASWTSWATSPATYSCALGPLLGPPLALRDRVLERARPPPAVAWLRACEVGQHAGPRVEQQGVVHPPIMPRGQGGGSARYGVRALLRCRMGAALLEVTVLDPRDVPGAEEGGADRLHLVAPGRRSALSPEPATSRRSAATPTLPVFVLLRLNDTWTTTGGELTRLVGLAEDYLGVRRQRASRSASSTPTSRSTPRSAPTWPRRCRTCPWTFGRADRRHPRPAPLLAAAARPARAGRACAPPARRAGWRSGTTTCSRPPADPAVAALLMPGGGLLAEQVPWFVRAGVRAVPPRRAGPARRLPQGVRRRRARPLLAAARSTTRWSGPSRSAG